MKKIKYIIGILMVMGFFSCNQKEYVAPSEFSDVKWYTSKSNNNFTFTDTMFVGVNNYIGFTDLSRGTVEHNWYVPASAKFLEGPISNKVKDFTPYIINDGELISSDPTVNVLFTEAPPKKENGEDSILTVKLYNTFRDSVSFTGFDTLEAEYINGLWVIENDFKVKVFDSVEVDMTITKESGETFDNYDDSTAVFEVEFGEKITFTDISTVGDPDARTWKIAGKEYTDETVTVTTSALGRLNVMLTARRENPALPAGMRQYTVAGKIMVVPSSKPFALASTVDELEDQTIQFTYNGLFKDFTSADAKAFFTATVNGNETSIDFIGRDEGSNATINIKLSETIYSNDVVVIKYNGGLKATDGRESGAFEETVNMHEVVLLDEETSKFTNDDNDMWIVAANTLSNPNASITLGTEEDGSTHMVLQKLGTGPLQLEGRGGLFNLQQGKKYLIKFKIWAPEGAGGYKIYMVDDRWHEHKWLAQENPAEEWVEAEYIYEKTSVDKQGALLIMNLGGFGPFKVKEITVREADIRPIE
ncbi:hypothetical protein MY04_4103 [Flammeovirga sp. MY04]|uniref:SusD/RagB family protein n=1 Tax=Flammeovirga yaeyamensis TaxID=367791 RepID=D0PR09_9BACT|nr:hypothetical protein [Flammeovirga sp. MY04]ACY02052.1 SusD/RagB family protein [Flammeovirga yaeyamensis]ANQ51447.1 hypothetical protein MY04_4103 [Flammeovirga sp. MY04]